MTLTLVAGYRPGCIGRVTELHAAYYSVAAGFDVAFEAKVARELAAFCEAFDEQRDGLWLVVDGERVEGSIAIDGSRAHDAGAHLRWFIVSDRARGRGFGQRLLREALAFVDARGYARTYLWTFEGLAPARHLYEKHGFRLVESHLGRQWGKPVHEQRFVREPARVEPQAQDAKPAGAAAVVRLRDLAPADLLLVERWLRADHVQSFWGDADANLRLLREPLAPGHGRSIVEASGRAVGLVLWQHPTRDELDVAGLADVPTSAVDIDVMIGEADAVGRGLGSAAIARVADAALADPAVPFVMGCAALHNLASQRAFEKAGFRRDRVFDDVPHGPHVLMVRHRARPRDA